MRASSLISLAALYYAKSDLHKAKEVLLRYENSGQVSSRSLLLSYLVEQRMGHIEKAETTAATILQTYPTSSEARLIREQQTKRSEFEMLRSQYRQAKLDELQANSPAGEVNSAPQIRIIKKKKAPTTSTTAQEIAAQTTATTQSTANANSAELNASLVTPVIAEVQNSTVQSTAMQTFAPPVDTGSVVAALNTATVAVALPSSADTTTKQTVQSNDAAAVMSALEIVQVPAKTTTNDAQMIDIASLSSDEQVEKALAVPTVHLATTPSSQTSTRVNKSQDGVKIVSFGAAADNLSIAKNSQPVATNQSQFGNDLSDGEKVVFYQPQRDAAVFSGSNSSSQPEVRFQDPQQNTQAPLLNSQIPQLTTPYHVLQDGENLFSISVRYNVKLQKLLQWNALKESDRVINGTKIYLNDPNIYYEINTGDTLYSIATKRRLLIDQLMRWNKLSPDVALKPGHRLLLVDPESYAL